MAQGGTLFRNRLMPVGAAQQGPIPVVPGAVGYGMETRAAYGGETNPAILTVTNLNDWGSGSLREAMTASGPRVVIFEISGTIDLQSDIVVNEPYLTVAGQTAPSPGITLRGATDATVSAGGIVIHTHDVLIQHLRIRPGDGGPVLLSTAARVGIGIYYGDAYNVVLANNSISWTGAKLLQIYQNPPPGNITFWRNILSEALWRAINVTDAWGISSLSLHLHTSPGPVRVSVIGNLSAHNACRNPEWGDGGIIQFVNNVIYDWGKEPNFYQWASLSYGDLGNPWSADFVGNKYIAGPPPFPYQPLYAIGTWNGASGSLLRLSDNAIDQSLEPVIDYVNYLSFDPRTDTSPVPPNGVTALPSSVIESHVLETAGARPLDRDAVDTRIVSEVTNRTGTRIRSQDDVGGWPTLAENTWSLSPPVDPHQVQPSGYTALEEWLHSYAAAVEG